MTRRAYTLVEVCVVIAVIGLLIALLLPAVQAAREASRRCSCSGTLKNVALALLSYEESKGAFPKEWVRGCGHGFDAPVNPGVPWWTGLTMPDEFQCPSNPDVLDIDGVGLTPFGLNMHLYDEPIELITDGTTNTVLHGEMLSPSQWVDSPGLKSIDCQGSHRVGANYAFGDGSVRFLSENTSELTRIYLLIPNDGQVIAPE